MRSMRALGEFTRRDIALLMNFRDQQIAKIALFAILGGLGGE
jgi:hypothetical protein